VGEGLDAAAAFGTHYWTAELYRLRGELTDAETDAQSSFLEALAIARRQRAKSFELRAATSLNRLRVHQGKRPEARALLAEVYAWFTEGSDTPDLKEARALL
jgi:predicted ATPase